MCLSLVPCPKKSSSYIQYFFELLLTPRTSIPEFICRRSLCQLTFFTTYTLFHTDVLPPNALTGGIVVSASTCSKGRPLLFSEPLSASCYSTFNQTNIWNERFTSRRTRTECFPPVAVSIGAPRLAFFLAFSASSITAAGRLHSVQSVFLLLSRRTCRATNHMTFFKKQTKKTKTTLHPNQIMVSDSDLTMLTIMLNILVNSTLSN